MSLRLCWRWWCYQRHYQRIVEAMNLDAIGGAIGPPLITPSKFSICGRTAKVVGITPQRCEVARAPTPKVAPGQMQPDAGARVWLWVDVDPDDVDNYIRYRNGTCRICPRGSTSYVCRWPASGTKASRLRENGRTNDGANQNVVAMAKSGGPKHVSANKPRV